MPKQYKRNTSKQKRQRLQLNDGRVFAGVDPVIDGNDLYTFEQRKRSLKLTNSSRISSNAIKPFLKQLMGTRLFRTQFMGRMINEAMNTRSHHLQLFRHNMYEPSAKDDPPAGVSILNNFSVQQPYSNGWKKNILYPINNQDFDPLFDGTSISQTPATDPPGVLPATATTGPPYRDMKSGETFIIPTNRSDLEDMCWNLNKFKLGTYNPAIAFSGTSTQDGANQSLVAYPVYGQTGTVPGVPPVPFSVQGTNTPLAVMCDVPRHLEKHHRGASRIWINNYQAEYDARLAAINQTVSLGNIGQSMPYSYKAVFNHGNIKYEFMNKGRFGSIVEVIVLRFKKTQYVASPLGMADPTLTSTNFINSQFTNAFVNAEIKRQKGIASTELLNGGYFEGAANQTFQQSERVVNDPDCPFCPETANLLESDKSMTRVSTKRFAMVSGARRTINIPLPGERFDPAKLSQWAGTTQKAASGEAAESIYVQPYMCDQFTYGVMIVVNGQRISQDLMANPVYNPANDNSKAGLLPPISTVLGDGYSPFDVQFNATYSETLSACEYVAPNYYNLTCRGTAPYSVASDIAPLVIGTATTANAGYKRNPAIVQAAAEQVRLGPQVFKAGRTDSTLGSTFSTGGTGQSPVI